MSFEQNEPKKPKKKRKKRERGTGSVYRRKGSHNFMLKYRNADGELIQESSGVSDEQEACNVLKTKLARIALGERVKPKEDKITVGQLYQDYIEHAEFIEHRRDAARVKIRWKTHLRPVFAQVRTCDVDKDMFRRYAVKRQQEHAKDSTINRELSIVRAAFYLAEDKLRQMPSFIQLKENNRREGYLDDVHYTKLAEECSKIGLWLRAMFELGYTYGWRSGGMKQMKVGQADLLRGTITLTAEQSKNSEAVTAPVAEGSALYTLLGECMAGKRADDYLFARWEKKTKSWKPIGTFYKAWKKICADAGVADLIFHDLRRTARRNGRRAGVPDDVVMAYGGWKTLPVARRYDIIDDGDLKNAALKIEQRKRAALEQMKAEEKENEQAKTAAVPDSSRLATVSATVAKSLNSSTNEVQ